MANPNTPPPGTEFVKSGTVEKGDWFYISRLGAWGPVPENAIGEEIINAIVVRSIKKEAVRG